MVVEFRLLGGVEAHADGVPVPLGAARQRCLLAVLLLEAPNLVHVERLIDLLWYTQQNRGSRTTVQVYVSRLRRALAHCPDVELATSGSCYRLDVDPDRVDAHRFRRLVTEARLQDTDEGRSRLLRQALALWRGQPLGAVAPPRLRAVLSAGLDNEYLTAWEDLADAELRLGRHAALVAEITELAERYPLRERLAAALMAALYRNGQRADALAHYRRLRDRLAGELGIDPSPELVDLHGRILRDDVGLAVPAPQAPPAPPSARDEVGRASPAVPAQLPADLVTFTGRTRELARLPAPPGEGETPPAVVISAIDGMAGVGKTALAVHWAHQIRDRFPDGQLFLDLHGHSPDVPPVDPSAALDRVLRALGVPGERIPRHPEDRAALYRSTLADRRVLVVLDNAHDEDQVRPLLPGTPGSLVVVTSRRRLTGLDTTCLLSLDVLPPDDAVTLFTRAAGLDPHTGADPLVVQEVAELAGRLPLALGIAAARLRARPHWTVEYLAALLRDERRRLAELDAGQRSVAAAFALSYRDLSPEQRRMFRLLGLHPGADVGVHAAAALAGTTECEAERLVEALVDAHLLQCRRQGRYHLHDLLRTYARGRCDEEDNAAERHAAVGRLFDHYAHAVSAAVRLLYPHDPHPPRPTVAGPEPYAPQDQAQAKAWLDAEVHNLLAAARHAPALGWPRFTAGLSGHLWRYLYDTSQDTEAYLLHTSALDIARGAADRAGQARTLVNIGIIEYRRGRYAEAARHHEAALVLAREVDDRATEIRALHNLGITCRRLGRYRDAIDHHERALVLAESGGDPNGAANALNSLGLVHWHLGRHDPALDCFRQALALFRQVGSRGNEANATLNIGMICIPLERYDEAVGHLDAALALFREIGNRYGEAAVLNNLGNVHGLLGRHDRALDSYQRALDLFRQTGNPGGESEALNDMGRTLLAAGRPDEALARHRDALDVATRIGARYERARALDGLAHAHHDLGRHHDAHTHWRAALEIFASLGTPEADQVRARLAASGSVGSAM
jgi:DNA-binding SARP family transcriptional activator/Flp pilus assembly protein TadD